MDKDGSGACSVCGDSAPQHLHYGAVCCYSCRAFFRRGRGRDFPKCLLGDNNCDINKFTRTNCKQCRYDRCLQVGMRPDKVDITGKRKKGERSGEGESNKETKANANTFKRQKTDLLDNPYLSNSKKTSVICFTGASNAQRQPKLINENEIKMEEGICAISEVERKQNMLRENQKKILMYNQQNGSERYSKMTSQILENNKKNICPPIFRQSSSEDTKFLDERIAMMPSSPIYSGFPPGPSVQVIHHPNLTSSPSSHLAHPIPSPHQTTSPHLTPHPSPSSHPTHSPHPTLSPHPRPSLHVTLTPSPHPTPSPHNIGSADLSPPPYSPHSTLSSFGHSKSSPHTNPFGNPAVSPHSTPSPHPIASPHRKLSSLSIQYPNTTPSPQPSPSPSLSSCTPPYLTNPTPPHDNKVFIQPTTNSPYSNFQPTNSPLSKFVQNDRDISLYKTSNEPIDISSPHSNCNAYLKPSPEHTSDYDEDIMSPSKHSPAYNEDIMAIVNMTPLYPSQQQHTFDDFLSKYSYRNSHITPGMQLEENEDEEECFDFSPEELTWVPIKKRARMTNYSVFPEKRHLNRKVVPVMAFTSEETAKIGQILIAQANMVSLESKYAMRIINPELILEQETSRVEAVANGEKILINEDYLQFRHKLSKEMFKTEGCMFFDQFSNLMSHDRNLMFESTFPSTIGLWFAYLHARRGAESLVQQENGLLCSTETEEYRLQTIPDILNSRSIRMDDFEIFTSPWAVNVEDEIKFESTITTLGDIIGKDFNISVIYFLMVLSHPHKDSILCRNILDKPAVLILQTEINELMYRYLKSLAGYTEGLAAEAIRSLHHLVSQLHECAHIFWKKRLKTSMDTSAMGPICIDELSKHVWYKQIHTLED